MPDQSPLALQPPDPQVNIRPVQLTDVIALHHNCWAERSCTAIQQMVERAQRNAQQGRGLGVVITADGSDVVGFGQLTLWSECGELSDLIIAAPYRGRGLGTTLVQYLTRTAREMHATCLEIGAAYSNPQALALYRYLGFQDHRTLQLNLGNGNEAVLFLRLNIPKKR